MEKDTQNSVPSDAKGANEPKLAKFKLRVKHAPLMFASITAIAGSIGVWLDTKETMVATDSCDVHVRKPAASDIYGIIYRYAEKRAVYFMEDGKMLSADFNNLSPLDREKAKRAEKKLPLECRFPAKNAY